MWGAAPSTGTAVEPGGTHPRVLGDWAARKGSRAPDPAWDTLGWLMLGWLLAVLAALARGGKCSCGAGR